MTEKAPLALDPADPVHADVLARLASDHIGWFTTVRADGSPHAVPVWFLWHDGRVLEISDAYTAKYAEAMVAYGMEWWPSPRSSTSSSSSSPLTCRPGE